MNKTNFSILMSLYIKEKPEYVRECFDSLLQQTQPATEWIVVEDGALTDELYGLLDEYQNRFPELIKRIRLKANQGLGIALRNGILHCKYELIARMDTDDIATKDRFEKQLAMFANNPTLDICGSFIEEFEDSLSSITAVRRVPLFDKEIKKYQKRRDAFNHVTVMFKKASVLKAGNYQHALLMEDSLLWVNMIKSGAQCANINECLVYVRAGAAMLDRRGGYAYFKKYKLGRRKIYETGYITWWDYIITLFIQFIISMIPCAIRCFIFKHFLREKNR